MASAADGSAYYFATIQDFRSRAPIALLGVLSARHGHDVELEQRQAWEELMAILQTALAGVDGFIALEFNVPRLGSRIDAVVVSGPAVFPIEFKCGETSFRNAAIEQAWDYALDLKNFHAGSHEAFILPALVATGARETGHKWQHRSDDGVFPPRCCSASEIQSAITEGLMLVEGAPIDGESWCRSAYHPTPTIIEAARALYANHSVEAISRSDAGARNLKVTSVAIEEIIEETERSRAKAIVFVTGVPGAGKTLVGLNVATRRRTFGESRAVYLSGNGPLVAVLHEALTRDEMARSGYRERKGVVRQRIKPFIQNVHHFRDEGIRTQTPPHEHVVIFDEAQRAWDRRKTANFMRRRKKISNFTQSEPEFLISYLDRHPSWSAIVCLVGGGQEIHDGEAGISEWLSALHSQFSSWRVYISPHLTDSEYGVDDVFRDVKRTTTLDERLHLAVSMRSFRSERISTFVKALLDCDFAVAKSLFAEAAIRYPIAVTRDLSRAKEWIRSRSRGSERFGLVASSQALRLKPLAIDVRVTVDPIHWFLSDRHDTRSSFYLEDAATEFQVQGLELDWTCVTWDADVRLMNGAWRFHAFRGDAWTNVKDDARRRYMLNAYRVLLTRARQGMVVFVPPGDRHDPTRLPQFYDETYESLAGLGLERI
jgi:hypothetical protein